ncbi:DUF2878 domain-containing protein [Marinobacter lacisalsi]|uniref:DUF2878 domain-containing protein n=1 Tax=Marinobacter lacisalsi TaxID=475979 RepID=A0ABV8QJU2_9GAMM
MASDTSTALKVVNFALFQAGWLACVLLTNAWAVAIAIGVVAFHLAVVSVRPAAEARFILLGVVLGSLLDGLWFSTGMIEDGAGSTWTPLWLTAIWALFMTTLAHSLAWMHQRIWLPFVFAPVAGPLAYLAASKLDAVTLPANTVSIAALAVGWLVIFPLLMTIQKRRFAETLA